jgi:hypothetical protein
MALDQILMELLNEIKNYYYEKKWQQQRNKKQTKLLQKDKKWH